MQSGAIRGTSRRAHLCSRPHRRIRNHTNASSTYAPVRETNAFATPRGIDHQLIHVRAQKHLCSMAIRLIRSTWTQRQSGSSVAIRLIRSTWAHQWQSGSSVAIRLISGNQAHQWQSSVALIRGTERHSIALSGTQVHSIELTSPPRFVIAVASEFATACANKREGHTSVVASGSLH